MSLNQKYPFVFFFIDDLLPECFGQKKGETFRSFLCDERPVNKKTYDSIKSDFQKDAEEFKEFEKFYSELRLVSNRDDFFSQKYLGNKKTHTGKYGLVEFEFSNDGRIDACIVQRDGIRCVFILDVRISNHYDSVDDYLHEANEKLSKRISSALDIRALDKTKERAVKDNLFRIGMIDYQNELLEMINTRDSKFEILLNKIDELIFCNKETESKVALFYDKLTQEADTFDETGQQTLYDFVEEKLLTSEMKGYHRELFKKLYNYSSSSEDDRKSLSISFDRIKMSKQLSFEFLTTVQKLIQQNLPKDEKVLNAIKIFNKIPTSHLYVLKDVLSDLDFDENNFILRKQLECFLENLVFSANNFPQDIFENFKYLLNECSKKKDGQYVDFFKNIKPSSQKSEDVFNELLLLSNQEILRTENIDKLETALLYAIVEKTPRIQTLFSNADEFLENTDTFGYQWIEDGNISDTFLDVFKKLIIAKNPAVLDMLYKKNPLLKKYINMLENGESLPSVSLYKVCKLFKDYNTEDEYDEAYNRLKNISSEELMILKSYYNKVHSSISNETKRYILSLLIIFKQEEIIEKNKKEKRKKLRQNLYEELSEVDKLYKDFVSAFSDFYHDIENNDKKQQVLEILLDFDKSVFKRFKGLPKDSPISVFIKNYLELKNNQDSDAFEKSINTVILCSREGKNQQLKLLVQTFFEDTSLDSTIEALKNLCSNMTDNDWKYVLTKNDLEMEKSSPVGCFLKNYQHRSVDNFDAFLTKMACVFEELEKVERQKRIEEFRLSLNDVCKKDDVDFLNRFEQAAVLLSIKDINFLMEKQVSKVLGVKRRLTESEKLVLPKLLEIKRKGLKNSSVRDLGIRINRLTSFQIALVGFFNGLKDQNAKDKLVNLCLKTTNEDFDTFMRIYQDDKIVSKFFLRMKQIKGKNLSDDDKKMAINSVVDITKKKFVLSNAIAVFLEQRFLGINAIFATEFLNLTENGYSELADVLETRSVQEKNLVSFFVNGMKEAKDKSTPDCYQINVEEFLAHSSWMVDFYRMSCRIENDREECLKKINKNENVEENEVVLREIEKQIKVQTYLLEMDQLEMLDTSGLLKEGLSIFKEVKKELFCRIVNYLWDYPDDKDMLKKLSSMYLYLDEKGLTDEIVRETEDVELSSLFIRRVQADLFDSSFNNISVRFARKKDGDMSIRGYIERKMEELLKPRKKISKNNFNNRMFFCNDER